MRSGNPCDEASLRAEEAGAVGLNYRFFKIQNHVRNNYFILEFGLWRGYTWFGKKN